MCGSAELNWHRPLPLPAATSRLLHGMASCCMVWSLVCLTPSIHLFSCSYHEGDFMHGPRATRLVRLAELKAGDIVLDIATGKHPAQRAQMAGFC